MNQKINGCSVFFPQRILSVEDMEVSGSYLGSKDLGTIVVNTGFEKILEAQSESKLSSNSQDNPLVVVFQNEEMSTSVIYDKNKKILFCHSFVQDEHVYIVKMALKKEFSLESVEDFKGYVKSHVGKESSSSEVVEVEVDGSIAVISKVSDLNITNDFFSASVTPLLRFRHSIDLALSNRGQSMVILDLKQKLLCTGRYDVLECTDHVNEKNDSSDAPIVAKGLEGYFDKIKKNK